MNNLELYRFIQKIGVGVPTIPINEDHSSGAWIPTDIYEGELYLDSNTNKLYTRSGSTIIELSGGSGGSFIPLSGTEVGSPVTGPIKVIEGAYYEFDGDESRNSVQASELNVSLLSEDKLNSTITSISVESSIGKSTFVSDNPNAKGYTGDDYYGANYDDNTYVQKKYVDGDTQIETSDDGEITSEYAKNIFIYKGTTDGNYDLPIASANKGIEIFIVNKSDYNLTVSGDIWDSGEVTSKIVSSSSTYHLISDGDHWVNF